MKTLFLIRHAEAADAAGAGSDHKRPLTLRGVAQAKAMASHLVSLSVKPDLLISSGALRAHQTAELFADAFGFSKRAIKKRELWYRGPDMQQLVDEIRCFDDDKTVVMIFGHNPTHSELAAYLVPGFFQNIPKAGVVGITFPVAHFGGVAQGKGQLLLSLAQRDLERTIL